YHDRTNPQSGSFPFAFGKPRYTADYQIRPKSTSVVTNGREHSVGRDQKRQDVESVFQTTLDKPRSGTRCHLHSTRHIRGSPRHSIHQNHIVTTQRSAMA